MKQSFYFYANPFQVCNFSAAKALADELQRRGADIYADEYLADQGIGKKAALSCLPEEIRAIIVFGGDGTLLRAAPEAARQNIPLLGVHTGTIGFLMPGDAQKPAETADLLLSDSYPLQQQPLLEILFENQRYLALNDLSLNRGEHPGVIETILSADGERIFRAHGDGVVISTPLGSTGYGLSAGGPIVRPDTRCLIVNPLCARELLLRPVILPMESKITLQAHGRSRRRLQLAIDGQILLPITEEATIEISLAREKLLLISPEPHHFFKTLHQKQAIWNQQEEQE